MKKDRTYWDHNMHQKTGTLYPTVCCILMMMKMMSNL